MKYVVVDLEMNKVAKGLSDIRKVCTTETIEIGAVVLDENYSEISSFMTYVRPKYNNEIDRKISKLTGITWDMVENAPEFEVAFRMFVEFCENLGDEYQIYEWSENDHQQFDKEFLQKQYDLNEVELKFMEKWNDFQEEFGEILGLERRVSLKNALMYAGEDFKGQEHDALYDARNTAELFMITRVDEKKNKALSKVIDYLTPKEHKYTIGDVIDFGSLMAAMGY